MDRDIAIKILEALQAIQEAVETIAEAETPADSNAET